MKFHPEKVFLLISVVLRIYDVFFLNVVSRINFIIDIWCVFLEERIELLLLRSASSFKGLKVWCLHVPFWTVQSCLTAV